MSCDTICWKCANACGKCSWSRSYKPVEGWDAKATKVVNHSCGKDIIVDSFKVKHCPQFVKDR